MIRELFNLFSKKTEYSTKDIEKLDCCILGYHKWVYVIDNNKEKRYRICDVCGKIEKGFEEISSYKKKKTFKSSGEISKEEKKVLFDYISYNEKDNVYILKCPYY